MKIFHRVTLLLALAAVTCQAQTTQTPNVMQRGSASGSILGNGSNNVVQTLRGAVLSGSRNVLLGTPTDYTQRDSVICGGESNIISGASAHSTIAGGLLNVTTNARYSFIGAWQSRIAGITAGASNAACVSGWQHTNECWNSAILSGWQNKILNTNNLAEGSSQSDVICGGYQNTLLSAYASVICGGQRNQCIGKGNGNLFGYDFIGSGFGNAIGGTVSGTSVGYYHSIVGGNGNIIDATSAINEGFIGGGEGNKIDGDRAVIVGGGYNRAGGTQDSCIVGGNVNTNLGQRAFIAAGYGNWITANGGDAAIIGGTQVFDGVANFIGCNKVDGNSIVIGYGRTNTSADNWSVALCGNDGNFDALSGASASIQDGYGFKMLGGVTFAVTNKTTTYTATFRDHIILCSGAGGAFTVTLPAATRKGQVIHVKKTDSGANAITVSRAGTDTIQGATTVSLATQYTACTIYSDGAGTWYKYAANQ